jgi:hypothetical protein
MADLLFEVEDDLMAKLAIIADSRAMTLEDYLRELIITEVQRGFPTQDGELPG